MFGGVEIYANGPCFSPTDTITCTFGTGDKTIAVTGTFTLAVLYFSSNMEQSPPPDHELPEPTNLPPPPDHGPPDLIPLPHS